VSSSKGEDTVAQSPNFNPQASEFPVDGRPSPAGEPVDPDHHLWRNGRLWWVAFTVHLPGWQKERVRLSLGTADLVEARRRRDQVLRDYPWATGCELSLRFDGRRRGATQSARCPAA
jgi:hypothetical protein